ncbi:MAG: hypothetical protein AAF512_04275 [Pseudomonadota bacterium]
MIRESEALRIFLTPDVDSDEVTQQAAFEFLLSDGNEGLRILCQAALMQAMRDNIDILFSAGRDSFVPIRPGLAQLRRCFYHAYRQAVQTLETTRTVDTNRSQPLAA